MSDLQRMAQPDLPKRFYTDVTVEPRDGGLAVLLDGKGLKTPSRRPLSVPSLAVAEAIAAEWRAQGERIDPGTMPLTRLVNTVIDGVADDPIPVRDEVARYAETDLLFYRADGPERLVARQKDLWDPLVAEAERLLAARFLLGEGVMHVAQPEASLAAVRGRLSGESDPFRIAALHQMTTITGSTLIALAVAEGRLTLDRAWAAAHVDEDWNIEQWGADEEAEARRARRFADMRAAAILVGAA
ncbi:ATPase [Aureimonas endophytica]|uniref:ATPase n=1 Tax=Aureimonas endophytica TaxID=2027858 RepID=A0A916ZE97_9HYPH|nr:ATP12 family protein [Aureimonas endophytica]GGD89661.1 ATPase [Aureimonas endophytica]